MNESAMDQSQVGMLKYYEVMKSESWIIKV